MTNTLSETKEDEVKPKEIFSSVYAPEKKEEPVVDLTESKPVEPTLENTSFDLPKLKEDAPKNDEIKPFSFDSIEGETYNINK